MKLKTLMKDLISEVLSGMFFSPAEFSDDFDSGEINKILKNKDIIIGNISVQDKSRLDVYAAVSFETMKGLAKDFTGKQDVSKDEIEGSLLEFLNMAGGGILADYFNDSTAKLNIPVISSGSDFLNSLSDKKSKKILFKCILIKGEILFACISKN
jgi:hypothetical protein